MTATSRRRFFQSGAQWDVDVQTALVGRENVIRGASVANLGQLMSDGGRRQDMNRGDDEMNGDWDDDSTLDL